MAKETNLCSKLCVNPESTGTSHNIPINRGFIRSEQPGQLVTYHSEYLPKNYKEAGTTGIELDQYMTRHRPKFKRRITSSETKGNLEPGGYLVSETVTEKMGHIIALKVNLDNTREYFDSEGKDSKNQIYYKSNEFKVKFNEIRTQHPNNNTCGPHSCFYLDKKFQNYEMEEIINLYPSQNGGTLEDNDDFINEYVHKQFLIWYGRRM